jgi:hypothetical protein
MNLSSSILFTLLYGDIFQYPYTIDELIGWLPGSIWAKKSVQKQLRYLIRRKKIFYRKPFYTIYGHRKNIPLRLNREHHAVQKWEKASRAASFLRFIPTISFVGITGGLSILNVDEEDDIDFYICAKKGTLWITRFLSTVLMELCAVRRRPGSQEVKDAICLNMFVTDDALAVPRSQRNVYTAHEVLQMQPLWERGRAYADFLKKNAWVASLFPHKWREVMQKIQPKAGKIPHPHEQCSVIIKLLQLLEKPAKHVQLWYMRKKRTSEAVSDTVIRFHPHDARLRILSLLGSRIKRYHLPLDKIFFQT